MLLGAAISIMDLPVNVPIDDPNADTEWYARACHLADGLIET